MSNNVLLDTSFCIRLMNNKDGLHQNAYEYYQYFLESKIEMYLSSIVISEYSVKDDINNLPLDTFIIIPFDYYDGKMAGEFYSILSKNKEHINDIERLVVKDDCKLIAQIYNRQIKSYITNDKKSFRKILSPIKNEKNFEIEFLDLSIPLKEYQNKLF